MKRIILITGGQRSGKSSYAEKLALSLSSNPIYMATSRIWDEEFRQRVIKHQKRRGPEWTNIEEEKELSRHQVDGRVVLIDCVTLWATNYFFDLDSDVDLSLQALKQEFDAFTAQNATFIFVTNEIGSGAVSDNPIQRRFTDLQGWMNQYIASQAHQVYLNNKTMKTFHIELPDLQIREALIDKINNLTKPKGSLGVLEELALQIGLIQQTLSPTLRHPHNILFAADHGIVEEGVSKSPKEITWQQLSNFLYGGAGVNFLCRQHGFKLVLVDAGVDYDLPYEKGIINCSVGRGTRSFLHAPAMSHEEMELCLERGAQMVDKAYADGCNVISFGEMGIGNTSPSSVWMHLFTGISLEQCVGAGSGLDSEGIRHKYNILKQAVDNYQGDGSARDKIAWFGGYEMVMAIGGMLRAAELKMLILVDGFIMTNCILAASRLHPEVLPYAIFGHQGDEAGHKLVLEALHARPLLNLGLRLGEGTGAVCAYPIIVSAVTMMNEMDNFAHAAITKYF